MDQVTYQSRKMTAESDAAQLRSRGERMLELATRAYCEQHYDFARLLTQLATEVFAHAREMEDPIRYAEDRGRKVTRDNS